MFRPGRVLALVLAVLLVGAAEAVGAVPKGTHHWADFVPPDELTDLRKAEAGRQERLSLEADDARAAQSVEALAARIEKLRETLAAAAAAA